jgi:hypothetical protein
MPVVRLIRVLLLCAGLIGSSAGAAAVTSHVVSVSHPATGSPAAAVEDSVADSAESDPSGSMADADRSIPTEATTPLETTPSPAATRPVQADDSTDTAASVSPADSAVPAVSEPAGNGQVYIGAVASGYDQAVAGAGVEMADHDYAFFSDNVPTADMISVSAGDTPWREVGAAGPGSALYGDIVRWAQTIHARGTTLMLAYNHEPEGHDRLTLGTPSEFIAAWQHVHQIFDQQGVTNVVWTWQMTEWAFRAGSDSEQYAPRWYPGDAWVDTIGADAYNWFTCGANATGRYNELQVMGDPVLAFARAHGKTASFPEFGAHANPNRAQWLVNAHRYLADNSDVVTAAFYFNRAPTNPANGDCEWPLTSPSEFAALRAMVQDVAYFRA